MNSVRISVPYYKDEKDDVFKAAVRIFEWSVFSQIKTNGYSCATCGDKVDTSFSTLNADISDDNGLSAISLKFFCVTCAIPLIGNNNVIIDRDS